MKKYAEKLEAAHKAALQAKEEALQAALRDCEHERKLRIWAEGARDEWKQKASAAKASLARVPSGRCTECLEPLPWA